MFGCSIVIALALSLCYVHTKKKARYSLPTIILQPRLKQEAAVLVVSIVWNGLNKKKIQFSLHFSMLLIFCCFKHFNVATHSICNMYAQLENIAYCCPYLIFWNVGLKKHSVLAATVFWLLLVFENHSAGQKRTFYQPPIYLFIRDASLWCASLCSSQYIIAWGRLIKWK